MAVLVRLALGAGGAEDGGPRTRCAAKGSDPSRSWLRPGGSPPPLPPAPHPGCQGGTAHGSDLTALGERFSGVQCRPADGPLAPARRPPVHPLRRTVLTDTQPRGPRGWWAWGWPGSPKGLTFATATKTRRVQTHVPGREPQVTSCERRHPVPEGWGLRADRAKPEAGTTKPQGLPS